MTVEELAVRVNALEAEVSELRQSRVELEARVDEMHAALAGAEPVDEDPLRRGHAAFEAEIRRQQERGEVG